MSDSFLSQEEVDALLEGVTGESQKNRCCRGGRRCVSQLRHFQPRAHCARSDADDGNRQ